MSGATLTGLDASQAALTKVGGNFSAPVTLDANTDYFILCSINTSSTSVNVGSTANSTDFVVMPNTVTPQPGIWRISPVQANTAMGLNTADYLSYELSATPTYAQPPTLVASGSTTITQGNSVSLTAKPNLALSFNASNYVATTLDAQPSAMPTTTWEAWVYPTLTNSGTRQTVMAIDDGGWDRGIIIEANTANFAVFTGTSTIWQPATVDLNTWQHIAVVYTSSGITFYKNGVPYTYSGTYSLSTTANRLNIGRNPGFGEYFKGQIDEVRVWNTVRAQSDIQSTMYAPPAGSATGLVGSWRFNEGSGTTATDLTGNYPGSLSGNPTYVTPGLASIGSATFAWMPVAGLNTSSAATVVASPTATTIYSVMVTDANATTSSATQTVTVNPAPDLTVSTASSVPAGSYTNLVVASGGIATLSGATTIYGAVTVQAGGTLNTNCQTLTGAGSFTLAAGGTLGICNAAGIASSGATGAVQTTGARSFSPDASYLYNGTTAQSTGSGLPSQVRNLSTTNANDLTLTAPTSVAQVVTIGGAGNLVLNGNTLTLLSSAAGTALVVNSGTGLVSGNTATVQRYIDASGNTGTSGYRHYSAPVSGATVGSLATAAFTPVVNSAYNSAANTVAVTPYPTVYGYDQSRVGSTSLGTNLSAFDQGYVSPGALTDPLTVGQGYTVQMGNAELISLTGTLNTGNQTIAGSRSSQTDAGWQLIGNPYPAPLDWGTVAGNQLTNMDAAAYVFQSTSAYSGRYTSFTNGIGANAGLIATGQGFFVRTNAATGSVALTNANRATTYGATPKFQRTAADARPQLRLSLTLGSAPATVQDEAFVYFEQGATAGFDGQYDAYKLANPSGYYLGTAAQVPAGTPETGLSISGRAPLTTAAATDAVPVWLSVPAGTYSLTATELANFAALAGGTSVYLRDALTGTLTNLATTPSYNFSVAANAPSTGRFTLLFSTATPLATAASAVLSQAVAILYPNPTATGEVTLSATGLPTTVRSLDATLTDVLGRPVGHYRLPAAQGAASTSLPTQALTSGIYLLRLTPRDAQGTAVGSLPTQRLSVR